MSFGGCFDSVVGLTTGAGAVPADSGPAQEAKNSRPAVIEAKQSPRLLICISPPP
jgi:hypothetical protein